MVVPDFVELILAEVSGKLMVRHEIVSDWPGSKVASDLVTRKTECLKSEMRVVLLVLVSVDLTPSIRHRL